MQESDEVYFLAAGGENVKVRDDVLDIKVLREIDGVGLHRWEPDPEGDVPPVRS